MQKRSMQLSRSGITQILSVSMLDHLASFSSEWLFIMMSETVEGRILAVGPLV